MTTPLPERITATPNPAPEGATISVTYTNPDLAGQEVEIVFDDGGGEEKKRTVQLDADGKKTFDFAIPPGWPICQINGPDSQQYSVTIDPN